VLRFFFVARFAGIVFSQSDSSKGSGTYTRFTGVMPLLFHHASCDMANPFFLLFSQQWLYGFFITPLDREIAA